MLFNKRILLAMATAIASFSTAFAQEATAPEDSAVVKLTTETFEEFVKEHPLVLAEFFAPWCGHCKNLAPEYVEAASVLEAKNIPVAQVDCTEEQDLCMKHGIKGYPTLKVFKNHQLDAPSDYQGARSASAIVSYMIKQSLPPVQVIEGDDAAEDFSDLLAEASGAVVVDTGVKGLNESFYELAELYRDDFVFVQYPAEKEPALSIYLPEVAEPVVYNEKNTTLDHLIEWVQVESKPYFGEVNGESFQSYMESGLPLAYFFYTSEEERTKYSDLFTALGKEYRGKINFAGLDASKFGRHAENLNMKEQFPLFTIHNVSDNLKYGLPQLSEEEFSALTAPYELDTKEISEFVKQFVAGELEPIIKSEEIPEVQESAVYKLVGKSHDEIVRDETKDVLVKYYAPWCGHCKRLAPTYEELAEIYASDDDAKDKVVIADIDATLNDVSGVEIEGFPTIILYPAGADSKPVLYESQRSLESFLEFIKKNGAHGIDGEAIAAVLSEAEEAEAEEEAADAEASAAMDEAEEAIAHDEL